MPIANLDRRLRELGRIRMGDRAPTGNRRPRKLETWRLTSPTHHLLDAAAARYGGEVRPWQDPPPGTGAQWELYTESDVLDIRIPAERALSQWYETWSGGGCQRRCDGRHEQFSDGPCVCQAELDDGGSQRSCKPYTRFNVLLPDLLGMGVWRLETKSYYAAVELPGTVEFLSAYNGIPAQLVITSRSVKRPGEAAKHFTVPAIELPRSLAEITAHTGVNPSTIAARRAIPAPAPPDPAWQDALEANYPPHDHATGEVLDGPAGDGDPAVSPPPSPAAFHEEIREAQQASAAARRRVEEVSGAGPDVSAGAVADHGEEGSVPAPDQPSQQSGVAAGPRVGANEGHPAPDSTSPPAHDAGSSGPGEAATARAVRDLAKDYKVPIATTLRLLNDADALGGCTSATVLDGDDLALARKLLKAAAS
jgi:hypothetical protein